MFAYETVKDCISEYIIDGAKSFIIYPYGDNGVRVNYVLDHYFFIKPKYIVDNIKSKSNKNIIDVKTLQNVYSESNYVILTVEREELNEQMLKELKAFVPDDKIINLLPYRNDNFCLVWEKNRAKLTLENILPGFERKTETVKSEQNRKIRIRVVHGHYPTWNVLKTLCEELQKDEAFDLKLIIGWNKDIRCIAQAEKYNYKYVLWDEYDAKYDCPDILVVTQPYDTVTQLTDVRKYAKLVIVASVLLISNTENLLWFWKAQEGGFLRFRPDYYLCDSMLYNHIINSEHFPVEIVEMGNAKYDGIYNACNKNHFPEEWMKLKGKRILLWTTDHGFFHDRTQGVTFDLYAKSIFEYVVKHPEMGLVFRPHPVLIEELIKEGYWTGQDLIDFKKWCNDMPNVIYDETETYDNAYSVADGIIADAICGITVSALPTLKPICVTYRTKDDAPFHPELVDNYYEARDSENLFAYMDMILRGEDSMYEKRKAAAEKFVKHFDGKNGWRIKEFIKEKYFEKIKEEEK